MKAAKLDTPLKGMREDLRWKGKPEHADRIENLERDSEGFWRVVPGTLQVGTWVESNGSGVILAMTWFAPRPNQRWLVVEQATGQNTSAIKYIRWPGGTPTTLTERRRIPGRPRSQFLQIGRWLYHFNGLQAPIRWDGGNLAAVGFSGSAPAPRAAGQSEGFEFVDLAGATIEAGVDANIPDQQGVGEDVEAGGVETARWVYVYGMTVLNDLGVESPMSGLVRAHGMNEAGSTYDNPHIGLSGVDPGKRGVRLKAQRQYRNAFGVRFWRSVNVQGVTAGGNPQLYLLDEFPLAGEFDYIDMHGDRDLGVAWDPSAVGAVPVGVRAAEHWQGSLWLAVEGRLHYSAPLAIEAFPAVNYRDIGGASSGMIVALAVLPAGLAVLKERGVYIVKGNHLDGFRVETLTELVGCAAPRSVLFVPGLGLAWLAEQGPVVLRGFLDADGVAVVEPIPGVERTWKQQVGRTITNAWAVWREDAREVWWHVPTLGQLDPSLGLVLHLDGLDWSLRPDWRFSAAVYFRGRLWLGSWYDDDEDAVGVHVLTRGDRALGSGYGDAAVDPKVPIGGYDGDVEFMVSQSPPGAWASSIPGSGELVGLYQTGVFRWDARVSVVRVGLLVVATGQEAEIELWQRLRQDEQFRHGSGRTAIGTQIPSSTRDTWETGVWSDDAVWSELEPTWVERSVETEATLEWQGRLRGVDLRVGAIALHAVETTNAPRLEG